MFRRGELIFKLPPKVQWFRQKAKWPTLLVSPISPISYCWATDYYFGFHQEVPDKVDRVIAAIFLITLMLGLFTFPRWYSFVAFAGVLLFVLALMFCIP
jgi:hypothetical protein